MLCSLCFQDDVGFRTLPDQSVRRHFQHGFAFNILCIGETGIGKSTLMDSLFNFCKFLPLRLWLATYTLDKAQKKPQFIF